MTPPRFVVTCRKCLERHESRTLTRRLSCAKCGFPLIYTVIDDDGSEHNHLSKITHLRIRRFRR